jgi:hypothetical protein
MYVSFVQLARSRATHRRLRFRSTSSTNARACSGVGPGGTAAADGGDADEADVVDPTGAIAGGAAGAELAAPAQDATAPTPNARSARAKPTETRWKNRRLFKGQPPPWRDPF